MPEGVTAEDISTEKDDIYYQNEASYADAEAVWKAEGHDCVIDKEGPDQVGKPQEVAVKILQDKWEASFAEIAFTRLAHGTCRRIGPERLVIRATVVVTGQAEEAGYPENEECRRKRQKARIPAWLGAEERVRGAAEEFWRIERRYIWSEGVMAVLKCRPCGVHDERAKPEEYSCGRKPPGIAA